MPTPPDPTTDPAEAMARPPATAAAALDTHRCPGGCGRRVPHHLLACKACWMRLPFRLRQPVSATHGRDVQAHAAAVGAAREWYRTNAGVRRG